jgi:hypothetical protein
MSKKLLPQQLVLEEARKWENIVKEKLAKASNV